MAESADILTSPDQKVILPDLAAGCSMADMARLTQVEDAWDALVEAGIADDVVPVTYMNSSADIKAFCGRNGGAVCTSCNAETALEWAFARSRASKVLFFPDQHLGRNTAVLKMGMSLDDCVVWDPHRPHGGLTTEQLRDARMILWKGHCSVHGRFSRGHDRRAARHHPRRPDPRAPRVHARGRAQGRPGRLDRVHHRHHRGGRRPARAGRSAPSSTWSSGSPPPTRTSRSSFLDKTVCYCTTMNRIDLPHFVWAMESLVAGTVVNHIQVDPETEQLGPGRPGADARPAGQDPQGLTPHGDSGRAARTRTGAPSPVDRRGSHDADRAAVRPPMMPPAGRRARSARSPVDPDSSIRVGDHRLEDPVAAASAGTPMPLSATSTRQRDPTVAAHRRSTVGGRSAARNFAALRSRFCRTARELGLVAGHGREVADRRASTPSRSLGEVDHARRRRPAARSTARLDRASPSRA